MLKVENVSAFYGNRKIIENISFEIKNGESFSIVGPNGCGKTTLLKCIANIIEFEGNISLNGKSIKTFSPKELAKEIAMLSQITHLYFNFSVFDIVMMGRYAHINKGFYISEKEDDRKKVDEVLKIVGLYDLKNRSVETLSGGQLQRVFLAKAIAQDPNIIILDEPTNHLDLSYQIEIIAFLKKWAIENNKTIIGVLHDINLAMKLTDKMMVLNEGTLKAFGNIKEIIKGDIINEAYKMNIKKYMLDTLKLWEEV